MAGKLEKALLQEIGADKDAKPKGPAIPVQFNPTTLKLQIQNAIEGGKSRGRQARQYTGSSSTTLSLELLFDTTDEGSTDAPVSVLEKTAAVERFVLPMGSGKQKSSPPKLRFQWGRLIFDGVVQGLSIDLEHFAHDGTPLRAKCSFSMQEQNPKYQFLEAGPGANTDADAPTPLGVAFGASGGLGLSAGIDLSASAGVSLGAGASIGFGASASFGASAGFSIDASAAAIAGESAADFAARVGIDPKNWRAVAAVTGGSLELRAGAVVPYSTDANRALGLGARPGAGAGADKSPEDALGLSASQAKSDGPLSDLSPKAGASPGERVAAGLALARAGGLSKSIEELRTRVSDAAALTTTAAFEAPAPARPTASDPRSQSYGFGVPLRDRRGPAVEDRRREASGAVPLRARAGGGGPPTTDDPTVPGWVALRVDAAGDGRRPAAGGRGSGCDCKGGQR